MLTNTDKGGRGVSQMLTIIDEGGRGGEYPPKLWLTFVKSPLHTYVHNNRQDWGYLINTLYHNSLYNTGI